MLNINGAHVALSKFSPDDRISGLVGDVIPPLVQLMNLYMLSKNPYERRALVDLTIRCLPFTAKGSIAQSFKSDPPLMFKSIMLREMNLSKAFIEHEPAQTVEIIKTQSLWVAKALASLYSVPSEAVPLTKLLLHADTMIRQKPNRQDDFGGLGGIKELLAKAALPTNAKPAVRAADLELFSPTYERFLTHLGGEVAVATPTQSDFNVDGGNMLKLLDVVQCLDEVSSAVHKALTSILAVHCASDKLLLKNFVAILVKPTDDSARNAFHYLCFSGAAIMLSDLTELFHSGEAFKKYYKLFMESLLAKDKRNQTPITYALMRFGKRSPVEKALRELIMELQSRKVDDATITFDFDQFSAEYAGTVGTRKAHLPATTTEDKSEEFDASKYNGGWDSRNTGDDATSEVCDILEILDAEDLPGSAKFYDQYVNTATPVIFRYVGLKEGTNSNRCRKVFDKAAFLNRYGDIVVPTATIPYAGSFGVPGGSASLREIADAPVPEQLRLFVSELFSKQATEASKMQSAVAERNVSFSGDICSAPISDTSAQPPLYTFCTPSPNWEAMLRTDIPLPNSITGASRASAAEGGGAGQEWFYETQFYLGPTGSGAPPHFHGHAINTLAYGTKEWFLYPPSAAFYSTLPAINFASSVIPSGSIMGETAPLRVTQHAGDVLYVPALWGHATLNTAQCIGVAHEFSVEQFCME